jgi:aldose 1-epimerase
MITSTALLLALAQGGIHKSPFGTTKDGKAVSAYELTNAKGAKATIITFGGIVTRIQMPDRNGKLGDVVLGFDRLAPYDAPGPYLGATVGRYANRIAKGRFTLDGKTYKLAVNNGPNALHGGLKAYDKRVWKATPMNTGKGPALKLTLRDPDGTEGYPGTVNVTVTYTLTNDNTLRIVYHATTTKATPINLTNHSYFNLKDAGKTDIRDHLLHLYADRYTPSDPTLIPTGELRPVAGTPYDFTKTKPMGLDIDAVNGYDTNYVINGGGSTLTRAAGVIEPTTGRTMETWTDQPGVQFYTAYYLDGTLTGRGGAKYDRYHAFCLETQHFPDSPNKPQFPSSILRPGKPFHSTTEYRFGTVK